MLSRLLQTRFPDCLARRRGRTFRIEFEYSASDFLQHRHPPRGADMIVCWENDWEPRPRKYKHLEIIDLKRHVGAAPRVIVVGCDEDVRGTHLKKNRIDWDVAANTQVDDLVVMYRTGVGIRDLWKVVGPFFRPEKWGREAFMKCVLRLNKPVTFKVLKHDPTTRDLGLIKKRFRGITDITEDWPLLCNKIMRSNPRAKRALAKYRID